MYGDAFAASTVVARLNGFVAGYGDDTQRRTVLESLDLPSTVVDEVRRRL